MKTPVQKCNQYEHLLINRPELIELVDELLEDLRGLRR